MNNSRINGKEKRRKAGAAFRSLNKVKGSGSKSGCNRHFFHEVVEIMFQLLQMVIQVLTLFKKFFMFGK